MFSIRTFCVACLLVLTACPPGHKPGPNTQDSGVDGGCSAAIGCPCNAGICSSGECVSGTCVACQRGTDACICRSNGTCDPGLTCQSGSCGTCTPGTEGCPCDGNTCQSQLACVNSTCVMSNCVVGTNKCPCRTNAPSCDGNQYCDGSSRCQTCSDDVVGCGCTNGMCSGGLVCNSSDSLCRAAYTCAALKSNGTCKAHETCNESAGVDASCVPQSCEAGYKWNAQSNDCVACVSLNCAMEPSCASAEGGLGQACDTQGRTCVDMGISSYCGGCKQGWVDAPNNQCMHVPSCGGVTCTASQYCDTTSQTPTCTALPCAAGQAKSGTAACTSCNINCSSTGFSGRVWPFRTNFDLCICETLDGYFLSSGGLAQATACDADGDGWVREEADDNLVRSDNALKTNARCAIRRADTVKLIDEYGISTNVKSCQAGLLLNPDAQTCGTTVPMRMLETQRNDIPGSPMGTKAPQYGASGRALEAKELNSLTKACVSTVADFNDNGVDDIAEVQAQVTSADDLARLRSFAYFMELYNSYYLPPATGQTSGTLVIQEASRCSTSFPLRYDPAVTDPNNAPDTYASGNATTYWRSCYRRRDPSYDAAANKAGYDFAQWSCSQTLNSCPADPPAHKTLVAPTDPSTTLFRNGGLCELNGQTPADGKWRGFSHHSQFKCLSVTATPTKSFEKAPASFGSTPGTFAFNACLAKPCASPTDPSCRTAQGTGSQSPAAKIQCTVKTPIAGNVGFGALAYSPYGSGANGYTNATYQGGCVTEDTEWGSFLCPFPEFSMVKSLSDSSYGRYSCYGKGSNYLWCSGPTCVPARATLRWSGSSADVSGGVLR